MRPTILRRLFAQRLEPLFCSLRSPLGSPLLSGVCVAAVLGACASPPRSSNHADAEALARAETAFAAMSASSGVKAAFLDALADDATLFRPGPVNGKAFMAARPDPAIVLEWRPQRVAVSGSDDLGYSTGPWKMKSKKQAGEVQYGQFFTVWRKNAAGRWQVLIDYGISHAHASGWNAPLETIVTDTGPTPTASIIATESRFSAASDSDGLASAYRAFGSAHLRVLREQEEPIDGMAALGSRENGLVAPSLAASSSSSPSGLARWTWTSTESGTARSSDLGWTMGRYRQREASGAAKTGYYVRMWRAERGVWKIVSDALAPIEEPARSPTRRPE